MPIERVRRDRFDIVAEILESARGGVIRTHVMYRAKLSYGQMCEYVPLLLEKGFLEDVTVMRGRHVWHVLKTTEMGKKLLKNLRSSELIWSMTHTA